MYVVDANVLVYAVDVDAAHHAPAVAWLDDALGATRTVGFPWLSLMAVLRVSTNARLFDAPPSVDEVSGVIEGWLARPAASVVEPAEGHLQRVRGLLAHAGTAGNLVDDAHLAALAIEHEAEIVSFDRDFGRFPGVRWRLPG